MNISLTSLMMGNKPFNAKKLLITLSAAFALIRFFLSKKQRSGNMFFREAYKPLLLVFAFSISMCGNTAVAQTNSNVTINTVALGGPAVTFANGTWVKTGVTPNWLYTFTPNADNAQLNVTEILNCFNGTAGAISGLTITAGQTGSVTIITNRASGGTQAGIITLSTPITATNASGTNVFTLTFTAANNININAPISLAGLAGATAATGVGGGLGDNVTLTSTSSGNIIFAASNGVTINGGNGGAGTAGAGGAGRKGGNITISTGGSVTVNSGSVFNTAGGAGGNGTSAGGAGGTGGTITIGTSGTPIGGAISVNSDFTSSAGAGGNAANASNAGGTGGDGGNISIVASGTVGTTSVIANGASAGSSKGTAGTNGGKGGTVTITSGTGTTVTIGGKIASNGGNGSNILQASGAGGTGGIGNTITITGPGGISIGNSDSLTAYGGNGGAGHGNTSGAGSAGGAVSLISGGAVTIGTSSGINTIGGSGGSASSNGAAGAAGIGGTISIGTTAVPIVGSISISSSLISSGGIGGNAFQAAAAGGAGAAGGNVSVVASGSVSIGVITSNGGNSGNCYGATGIVGGNGGTITITSGTGTATTINGKIASNGGNGGVNLQASSAGGKGGNGNTIILTGPGGISIGVSDSLTAYGGNGGVGYAPASGAGGNGGIVQLISAGSVTIGTSSGINVAGGTGANISAPGAGGAGGSGGTISIGTNGVPIGGSINISSSLLSSGGTGGNAFQASNAGGAGGSAGNITVAALGSTGIIGIMANGGSAGNAYGIAATNGGNAGTVTINSGSGSIVTIGGKIASNGGNGGTNLQASGTGGTGGTGNTISITGTGGISIGNSDSLTAYGGNGGIGNGNNGGNGGAGNVITLISSAGAVVIGTSSGITTVGGSSGGSTGTRGNGGNAAAINITGFGGVTMPSNLTATGGALGASGTGGTVGTAASITINDGNATVTSGGVNDGVSGIISGLKFSKSGAGTLNISGANTYTDSTSLYGGRLQLAGAARIPDASNIGLYGGGLSTGATIGYNETAATIKLTDNSTINVGTGGHSLNFSASNGVAWTAGKILTITNWNGPYDGTTAGPSNGKIYVGSNASGLTTAQLAQIKFLRPSNGVLYDALILSTGEVVAYDPAVVYINVLSITYPSCTGNTGSITVGGFGGVPPYTFNINSGLYQSSGIFSGLGAGTYTLGVKDNNGQTKTTTVQLDVIVITSDTGTCNGNSIQLQTSGQTAYSYSWSPSTGLSSSTIPNPVATPSSTTTYTLSAMVIDNTVNLISNPGFESGNTGFTSSYIHHTCGPYNSSTNTTAPNPWPCAGQGPYPINHNGLYKVSGNTQDLCVNLNSFGPRTGSFMMIVDGTNDATYAASPAWQQTFTGLTVNTNYVFTYYIRRAFAGTDAVIRTKINGFDATGTTSYPNPYTANNSSVWTQLSYVWNSGASTSATIEMYDQTTADVANDFALDDMSFYITCNASKNVTVAITVTPTLTAVAQPVKVCAGTGASINLTGLTTVDTFTVNYTINGISQTPVTGIISDGSGNATFTSAVLTVLNDGQVLEVSSLTNTGGHSNCTQTFSGKTVTLTVNAAGTWLGTTNTDWNTASNWCGGVPISTTDVLIPDYGGGGTYPIIASSVAGTCRNITISTNASVSINTGGSLAVSGTYSSNGAFTNDGEFIFNSNSLAQSFPGPTGTVSAMNNFTINNTSGLGVTFNRDFSIYGALTPTAGVVNVNNALVTLTSTATTTARVGIVGGGSGFTYTGTGEFALERYYPQQRSWRLVTAPLHSTGTIFDNWQLSGAAYAAGNIGRGLLITGPTATSPIGPDGLDISQQQNPSLKVGIALTPVANTHVPLSKNIGTSADNIGYFLFVRGDRDPNNTIIPYMNNTTVTSRGKLQTGTQVFAGGNTANGLELVGNPYASPVSFKTLIRNNLNNRFYAWDPSLNAQGGWVTIDDITNTGSYTKSPTSPGGQDSLIQSCQAILIETAAAGASSITFDESNKVTQNNLGMFRPINNATVAQPKSIRTNLYIINPDNSTTLADGNLVQFDERFSNAVTKEDAAKFFNIHETFFLVRNNQSLSIERKLANQYDTVFFKLAKFQQRKYRFELIAERFAGSNMVAFLDDNYKHTRTPLNFRTGTTSVDFDITGDPASAAPDRFKIIFRPATRFIQVHTVPVNQNVQVEWRAINENDIDRYEIERSVDGIVYSIVSSMQPAGNAEREIMYSTIDVVPSVGEYYYRIKGINKNGTEGYSEVSKVKVTKSKTGISIYPNPVAGNTINLLMNNIPEGRYSAVLINSDGQELAPKMINHKKENVVEAIKVNEVLTKGTYHLKIAGPENYTVTLKVLY